MYIIETVFQSALFVSSMVNLYDMPKNHAHFTHQVSQLEMKYNTINNRKDNSAVTIAETKKQMNNLLHIALDFKTRIETDLKKLNKVRETGFSLAFSSILGHYKYKFNETYWPEATVASLSAAILSYQFHCAKKLETLLARLENLTTKIKISVDTIE